MKPERPRQAKAKNFSLTRRPWIFSLCWGGQVAASLQLPSLQEPPNHSPPPTRGPLQGCHLSVHPGGSCPLPPWGPKPCILGKRRAQGKGLGPEWVVSWLPHAPCSPESSPLLPTPWGLCLQRQMCFFCWLVCSPGGGTGQHSIHWLEALVSGHGALCPC